MIQRYYDAINWLAKNTLVINDVQRAEKYKHIATLDELVYKYKKLEKWVKNRKKLLRVKKCQKYR